MKNKIFFPEEKELRYFKKKVNTKRNQELVVGANTIIIVTNSIIFGENTEIFQAYTVKFWAIIVLIVANTVTYNPNTVVLGIEYWGKYSCKIGK